MRGESTGPEPIFCAPLLRRVDEKLIDLLRLLTPDEWDLQTIAPLWTVRNIAAHLLDTVLRKLSMVQDSCCVEAGSIPYQAFISRTFCVQAIIFRPA
jgi:hypothetical protein